MRSVYYIATVIMCYREIIDRINNHTLTDIDKKYYAKVLDRVANRDTTPQFYQAFPGPNESYFQDRLEVSNQDFLGMVLDYDKEKHLVKLEERNYFQKGDIVEFIGPNLEPITYTINKIIDEDGNVVEVARHPQMIVYLEVPEILPKFAMMRMKIIDKNNLL